MTLHLGNYREVLSHVRADLIFTSPPYNLPPSKRARNDVRRGGDGRDHRMYSSVRDYDDCLPEQEYQDQQAAFLVWCAGHLNPGGTVVYNHKPRQLNKTVMDPHRWLLRPEVEAVLLEATYPVTWDRGSTHMMSPYLIWQRTETLYVLRRTQDQKLWSMRNREKQFPYDIWRIPHDSRLRARYGHCSPFPLQLAVAVIDMWSTEGQLVCDPYAGSATVAIAARQERRRFEGAEVRADYHAAALQRIAGT